MGFVMKICTRRALTAFNAGKKLPKVHLKQNEREDKSFALKEL